MNRAPLDSVKSKMEGGYGKFETGLLAFAIRRRAAKGCAAHGGHGSAGWGEQNCVIWELCSFSWEEHREERKGREDLRKCVRICQRFIFIVLTEF